MSISALANAFLLRVTRASLRYPAAFLLSALVLVGVSVKLTIELFQNVRTDFVELLPSDVPSAATAREMVRRVGGESPVFINIEALDGPSGLPACEALAPKLAADFKALGPDSIRAVEFTVKPTHDYFADHWPLFASTADLQKALDTLERRANEADPFDLDLDTKAKKAAPAPEAEKDPALLDPKEPLPREKIDKDFARYKDGFLVHPDGASLLMVVRPAGSSLGVDGTNKLLARMHAVVDAHKAELDAGHLRVGFAGSAVLFIAETGAVIHDAFSTVELVMGLVLVSLFLFFRDVRSTVSLGIACVSAVLVTFGVTRLVIGYLNTQTAFLGSVVIGNGINYGLIYLARVRQLRRSGVGLEEACLSAAPVAAHATLLAAAASSVSFGMLIAAANRGFHDFGIIGGVGMMLCWVFTFTLLPALLVVCERIRPVKADPEPPPVEREAPGWLRRAFARPMVIVGVFSLLSIVSAALFIHQIPVAIEHNLEHLGNERLQQAELLRDHDRGNASLGKSSAGVIALLPSREAADAYCVVIRERIKDPRYSPVIQSCDTVSAVVPADQAAKLEIIKKLAARITGGVVNALPEDQRARARSIRADLQAQGPIDLKDVPGTLLDRFKERDGTVGRLASVTASGAAHLELGERLIAFTEGVRNVPIDGKSYDATGENVVFADLLKNIETEGPLTTVGSLVGVIVLVVVFFRNARMTLEVLAALIAGVIMMGGAAAALHIKINFFNFIVFPITFGIAVDYGANIVVRVQERRGDVLGALAEVGPAVALCSWTSMVGYGTLLIALNRALQSFGWYAVVGEITSILTALILLPALCLWRRDPVSRRHGDPEPSA